LAPQHSPSNQSTSVVCSSFPMSYHKSEGFGQNGTARAFRNVGGITEPTQLPGVATRTGIPRTWSMREETVTTVRYCPILGCEVVVRLTYEVGEGPRPDIVRWFLVRQEMLNLQPSQGLIWRDDASQVDPSMERRATPRLQSEEPLGHLPRDNAQG